jgi:hypothetical protein
VIYGLGAGLSIYIASMQMRYHQFNTAYQNSLDRVPLPASLANYSSSQLHDRRDRYHVNRNNAIAGLAVLYLGNVFDAYRDAYIIKTGHRIFYFSQPHSPKKAAAFSAMLPGLGQGYNHKYWKIPLIYAAGAGLGWFFWYEQGNFDLYTAAYHAKLDPNNGSNQTEPLVKYRTVDYLLESKNYFNRYRDLAVIGLTAWYILNVVDAAVDAHFWNFDKNIDDNLGMHITPVCLPVYGSIRPVPGIRFSLQLH